MEQLQQYLGAEISLGNQYKVQLNNTIHIRPLDVAREPTPSGLGTSTQCGSALATEIDAYRRRIQTLLHFFDCISPHWWDRLHVFKREFIKRPSKSAEEVRAYQARLSVRLIKLTMRTVVPAAAAIAIMEAHAAVKVLPDNVISAHSHEPTTQELPSAADNSAALLYKAYGLARRLGDIEKLKQRLITAALNWIQCDGRDFSLRAQRLALLARHMEPCLIEGFPGVRALLTHYYRPRVLLHKSAQGGAAQALRAEPITAAKLTSTKSQIVEILLQVFPRLRRQFSDTAEAVSELNSDVALGGGSWQKSGQQLGGIGEEVTTDSDRTASAFDMRGDSNQLPILPSIMLNPLSVDTSQLEWLSYEVNDREFNLHTVDPEDTPLTPTDRGFLPTISPIPQAATRSETVSTSSSRPRRGSYTQALSSITKSVSKPTSHLKPSQLSIKRSTEGSGTTVTKSARANLTTFKDGSFHVKKLGVPRSSKEGTLISSILDVYADITKRLYGDGSRFSEASVKPSDATSDSGLTVTTMSPHGEGAWTPGVSSSSSNELIVDAAGAYVKDLMHDLAMGGKGEGTLQARRASAQDSLSVENLKKKKSASFSRPYRNFISPNITHKARTRSASQLRRAKRNRLPPNAASALGADSLRRKSRGSVAQEP